MLINLVEKRFSNDCRKTIPNQLLRPITTGAKQRDEPVRTPSNYLKRVLARLKSRV